MTDMYNTNNPKHTKDEAEAVFHRWGKPFWCHGCQLRHAKTTTSYLLDERLLCHRHFNSWLKRQSESEASHE